MMMNSKRQTREICACSIVAWKHVFRAYSLCQNASLDLRRFSDTENMTSRKQKLVFYLLNAHKYQSRRTISAAHAVSDGYKNQAQMQFTNVAKFFRKSVCVLLLAARPSVSFLYICANISIRHWYSQKSFK
jgi:hypothetical protein